MFKKDLANHIISKESKLIITAGYGNRRGGDLDRISRWNVIDPITKPDPSTIQILFQI